MDLLSYLRGLGAAMAGLNPDPAAREEVMRYVRDTIRPALARLIEMIDGEEESDGSGNTGEKR